MVFTLQSYADVVVCFASFLTISIPALPQYRTRYIASTLAMIDENETTSSPDDGSRSKESRGIPPASPLLLRTLSSAIAPQHHSLLGIILITMGSFTFSCMFLFVKLLQGKANTFTLSFYRALVETPIALLCCWISNENPAGPRTNNIRKWLWVRGGMGAAAVLCFFYSIQHLPLPDAVTLQFTTPPFAAAFSVLFAHEKWTLLDAVGSVVCLLGVALIAHPSWLFGDGDKNDKSNKNDNNNLGAVAMGLLGAAFCGMAYMSVRKIGHEASANVMVLYYSLLSIPATLLGSRILIGTWNVWGGGAQLDLFSWCLVLLTGVTAYTGQYLTNLGLQRETAAMGTLATCSQIVYTYGFELAFLHETISLWSIVGTVLILGFMVLVGVVKIRQANDEVVAGEDSEELALSTISAAGERDQLTFAISNNRLALETECT